MTKEKALAKTCPLCGDAGKYCDFVRLYGVCWDCFYDKDKKQEVDEILKERGIVLEWRADPKQWRKAKNER